MFKCKLILSQKAPVVLQRSLSKLPNQVSIVEVGPRDGLQNEKVIVIYYELSRGKFSNKYMI